MSVHKWARPLSLRHLSIRVAWQDIPWDGRVCNNPGQNAACLILKNVRQNKDETRESSPEVAGQVWTSLAEADLAPCVNERAGFMAPFELVHDTRHPYAETSPLHGHFQPTPLRACLKSIRQQAV